MQGAAQEESLLVIRLSLAGMAEAAQEAKVTIQLQLLVQQTLAAAAEAEQLIHQVVLEVQV